MKINGKNTPTVYVEGGSIVTLDQIALPERIEWVRLNDLNEVQSKLQKKSKPKQLNDSKIKKELDALIKKASNRVAIAERRVHDLEVERAEAEAKMNHPDFASDTTLFTNFNQIEKELILKMEEWEEAIDELEELEKQRG